MTKKKQKEQKDNGTENLSEWQKRNKEYLEKKLKKRLKKRKS